MLAREKDVQIIFEKTDKPAIIKADKDRIEQVLINLIDNAFHNFGNKVSKYVNIKICCNEDELVIKVADNGNGIPQEDIPFIWERFFKIDKSRAKGESGTGLGLAIIKSIVEAHEGKISVTSELNKGTVYEITLPLFH